jgi:hypothetical protein
MDRRLKMAKQSIKLNNDHEELIHDEAIIQALSGTKRLRNDLAHWRETADKLSTELIAVRQENQMLRERLVEVTAKGDYHQRWNGQLVTKVNDLEMFAFSQMEQMVEATKASAKLMTNTVNTVADQQLASIQSTAEQQVANINAAATSIKKFLDELHNKHQQGEYVPPGAIAKPADELPPLTEDEETRLQQLATQLSPREETAP